jgi:predicted transcriptional regulator of viral defense system
MSMAALLTAYPVLTLDEAADALALPGGRGAAREELDQHVRAGLLKQVAHGVYAVVPPGVMPEHLRPDPALVAVAIRPEGIFAYHSAFEILGVAHSVWTECTLLTPRRRKALDLNGFTIRFLGHPATLRRAGAIDLGTRRIQRGRRILEVTGPERSLVDSLRNPGLAGGLEEVVLSAGAFPALDLELVERILNAYDVAGLWAAVGWFLERHRTRFRVPEEYLTALQVRRPRVPQYLERGRERGLLVARWNLVIPRGAVELTELAGG